MAQKVGFRSPVPSPSGLAVQVPHKEIRLKVWVRLDSQKLPPDTINQATAIEFEREDTIDDLKDRIFRRFRDTRWAQENDSFGIAIGCWCECGFGATSAGDLKDLLLQPVPNMASNAAPIDLSHAPPYIRRTSRTCSPHAATLGTPPSYSPHPAHPSYNKLQCSTQSSTPLAQLRLSVGAGNKELGGGMDGCALSPVRLGSARRLSRTATPAVGEVDPDSIPHQSLLEPDELVFNVCKNLFGGVAAQTANDALVVFSNNPDIPLFDETMDGAPMVEDLTDYKLVVDEEQLRKLSHTNDEENIDCPKQAILLLPRGFEGDVNLPSPNVATPSASSPPALEEVSPGAAISPTQRVSPVLMTSAPLVEEEIGLVPPRDPIVQREGSPFILSAMESVTTESITRDKVFPKISVLVVEDNMINQAILSSFLRKHKIHYKVAKNGVEAVDRWKEGGMHLILMDLEMPLLSGIDAAKEIRKLEKQNGIGTGDPLGKHAELKGLTCKAPVIIVALTASNSQTDKTEALLAGCNDYLTKPVNLDWLTRKITEWGCMQALIDFDDWKDNDERLNSCIEQKAKASQKTTSTSNASKSTNLNKRITTS
ncbi:mitogen-activated protein kinase kinase kinase SSK1 [Lachancea thermotolerans CBS 6340]|uniref:KLTH0B02684p n=1 Tax=Lachancea thermotolerans (strain ATCC 56472 / CBS 6340 / NRRL Y-8284) TaxID=559295 RepID=C5DCF7_LACTC|nr:KLTH0B02684p [Lachancea thermotolerans CBS 6340]CAR21468.1 KLTH0B02684p [Lachancea thermotolerans CBS 6340]